MADLQPPVIVVPGITGTSLADYYNIPPEDLWRLTFQNSFLSILPKTEFERVALHPDDRRYEAKEPSRVRDVSMHDFAYSEIVNELRHELAEKGSTPVFPFPYDWRDDCEVSADFLAAFAKEVVERVSLIPGDYRGYNGPVDIVCHSMGGLVAADCVNRYGKDGLFRKVVSLGTPFRGSVEAVWKLTTGQASQWMSGPSSERVASRTLPSVYQLLPSYRGAVITDDPALEDLFDAGAWQEAMTKSLGEFIKKYEADARPEDLLQSFLAGAKKLKTRANSSKVLENLKNAGGGWLAIVGIDCGTYVNLISKRENGGVRFVQTDAVNDYAHDKNSRLTGDNTVPFDGAVPGFLELENIVCVTKDDFKFLEYERLLDLHIALPRMDLAQRMAIKFLKTTSFYLPKSGRPAPGVPDDEWAPPISFDS